MATKADKLENLLIQIVMKHHITEQSQLLDKLKEHEIDLPQSTLSRWLKKLNIFKINNRYQMVNQESLTRIPLLSIKVAPPNLLVLHTLPGNANSLAIQIDNKILKEDVTGKADPYAGVLGTIAGDDTVLIIMENEKSLQAFKRNLEENFESYYILYT